LHTSRPILTGVSVSVDPTGATLSSLRLDPPRSLHQRWRVGVPFAILAVTTRLLILRLPLSPDEGGYLLAASHWHHGTATYGAYFVDRPPLLMVIYALADLLGGGVALRLVGAVAACCAVLLAGRIGGRMAAVVATVFVVTPLFGTTNVDGELLALPLILGGLLALLRSLDLLQTHRGRAAAAAGALAMAGFLVKQDMVDVFVGAAAACAALAVGRQWQQAAWLAGRFVSGAVATGSVGLCVAWLRGTSPARLWEALVSFRIQAGTVISSNGAAAGGTDERLHALLQALFASAAPIVAVAALIATGRPVLNPGLRRGKRVDLRWIALPVLAWEVAGVLLGGSYWLHYLIALIPALVLLVAAAAQGESATGWGRWSRRLLVGSLIVAAISTSIAFADVLVRRPSLSSDARVSAYLATHHRDGDTAVVAFGHPDILYDAGLTSPYEDLWSLPVRVRDPRLDHLTTIMLGPDAPRWIVVAGASLGTWGVDATTADHALFERYRIVAAFGDWHVFEHD